MFRNSEYIYAVWQAGSFSAAAKILYISQPCLSAMVRKTEQQLGVPLFDRKSKPLRLTEYGEAYIYYLEKARRLERDFEQHLNDVRGLRSGQLSIGSNNVFASYVLPSLIRDFNQRYPGVKVRMTEGNIIYLKQSLTQGTLDLVLDNCAMDTTIFEQYPLANEHLLLAAHISTHDAANYRDNRLTHTDILVGRHLDTDIPALSISIFSDAPFIALKPGNDTHTRMESICAEAGFTPNILLEVDQLATAYNIACTGLGVTLVSDTLLRKTATVPDICYYKLCSNQTSRPIYLYHKRSRYVTKAMQEFITAASSALASNITTHQFLPNCNHHSSKNQ